MKRYSNCVFFELAQPESTNVKKRKRDKNWFWNFRILNLGFSTLRLEELLSCLRFWSNIKLGYSQDFKIQDFSRTGFKPDYPGWEHRIYLSNNQANVLSKCSFRRQVHGQINFYLRSKLISEKHLRKNAHLVAIRNPIRRPWISQIFVTLVINVATPIFKIVHTLTVEVPCYCIIGMLGL